MLWQVRAWGIFLSVRRRRDEKPSWRRFLRRKWLWCFLQTRELVKCQLERQLRGNTVGASAETLLGLVQQRFRPLGLKVCIHLASGKYRLSVHDPEASSVNNAARLWGKTRLPRPEDLLTSCPDVPWVPRWVALKASRRRTAGGGVREPQFLLVPSLCCLLSLIVSPH